MQYKALMLDLDGTTIPNRRDGLPSSTVKKAIAKAQKIIHVSAVTSRPLHLAIPLIKILKLSSLCIVDGGAQIYDPTTKQIIWEQAMKTKDVTAVWNFAQKNNIDFLYSDGAPVDHPRQENIPKKVVDIIFLGLAKGQADKYKKQLSAIPTLSLHKIVSWEPGKIWLKISHIKATKQYGILLTAEKLGIKPQEIIGVGDGYNDFPLLMACGLKVAMGNAVAELKAIADYIAPSVEENGVVDVIEKFVLQ